MCICVCVCMRMHVVLEERVEEEGATNGCVPVVSVGGEGGGEGGGKGGGECGGVWVAREASEN